MHPHLWRPALAGLVWLVTAPAQAALALHEAELLALTTDPAVARQKLLADAYGFEATAERQLPDPRLRFGVEGLSTDPVALDAEEMTQLQLGLMQELPRGDTLEIQGRVAELRGAGARVQAEEQARKALLGVRTGYLEAWFQQRAAVAMAENRKLLARVAGITEAQYAAGRDNRQEVLAARLEIARVDDLLSEMRAEAERARGELARWVGDRAQEELADERPVLSEPGPLAALVDRLPEHPRVRAAESAVQVGEQGVALAKEAYKPGFELELAYGKRFGEGMEGEDRSDLVTAMVTMDLPIFTDKRQDQRLAARQKEAMAMRYERDEMLRELRAELSADYAAWRRARERIERYRKELMPRAEQNAEAATTAYQTQVTPFAELMRAYMARVDTRVELLRLELDEARLRARIAYYAAEKPAGELP